MSNYYSTSLSLILQNAGENSTTWGSYVNTNFQTLLEQAIVGQTTITMANADYTLTSSQGVSNEARNAVLIIGGNQNATYNVIVPAVPKLYIITNNLASAATAYLKVTGSATSFSVAYGNTVMVYCTGSNSGIAFFPVNFVPNATNATNATNVISGGTIASNVTATTQGNGDNSTKVATTAYVANATSALNLGTMASQNANNVVITGGSINGTTIGASAATTGAFTTLGGTIITASGQFIGPGTGLVGTASNLSIGGNAAGTAGGLSGTPNISVGTITSGAQTVTGASGNAATVIASGVSVTNTITGVATYTTVHSGYALNASSAFNIYTNNTAQLFTFSSSGITSTTAGTTISAPTLTSTVATGTAPLTVTSTTPVANLSVGGSSTKIANTGGWNVTPSGTKLYFNYNGVDVASLDSSGNLIVKANVTAYGTP